MPSRLRDPLTMAEAAEERVARVDFLACLEGLSSGPAEESETGMLNMDWTKLFGFMIV